MKKIFDNIHSMVNDVLQVLDEFATAWQGNARAVGIINRLKWYLPDIEAVDASVVLYSRPFTRRKRELKPELRRMAKLIVSSFLVAFAIIETFAQIRELSRNIQQISDASEGHIQQTLLQRGEQLITEILDDHLKISETESSVEINFAVLKFKHTVKRGGGNEGSPKTGDGSQKTEVGRRGGAVGAKCWY